MLIAAVSSQPDVHWIKFGETCFDGMARRQFGVSTLFLKRVSTVEKEAGGS